MEYKERLENLKEKREMMSEEQFNQIKDFAKMNGFDIGTESNYFNGIVALLHKATKTSSGFNEGVFQAGRNEIISIYYRMPRGINYNGYGVDELKRIDMNAVKNLGTNMMKFYADLEKVEKFARSVMEK